MSNWQTINSKVVHQNPFWSVWKDRVIRPDGSKSYFYREKAPKYVVILPITKDGKVFIVGQYRYAVKRYFWELPAGGIDAGETPLQAAKRELLEEIGAKAKKITPITSLFMNNGYSDQRAYFFLAQDLTLVTDKLGKEPGEVLKRKKLSLRAFEKMIKAGKIDDGPSVLTFLLYQAFKKGDLKS